MPEVTTPLSFFGTSAFIKERSASDWRLLRIPTTPLLSTNITVRHRTSNPFLSHHHRPDPSSRLSQLLHSAIFVAFAFFLSATAFSATKSSNATPAFSPVSYPLARLLLRRLRNN